MAPNFNAKARVRRRTHHRRRTKYFTQYKQRKWSGGHLKMVGQFNGESVSWIKDYMTNPGIQVSDQRRDKRKAELVKLARRACEMKISRTYIGEEEFLEVLASDN